MTTLHKSSHNSRLPTVTEYPRHVEKVMTRSRPSRLTRPALGRILLVVAGVLTALAWLWVCAYSDLFL